MDGNFQFIAHNDIPVCVEVQDYSVAYFDHIGAFEVGPI